MSEAEKAFEAWLDTYPRKGRGAEWLAACAWQRERDAQIGDRRSKKAREFAYALPANSEEAVVYASASMEAEQYAAEIRKQKP